MPFEKVTVSSVSHSGTHLDRTTVVLEDGRTFSVETSELVKRGVKEDIAKGAVIEDSGWGYWLDNYCLAIYP
jgi:hypothetical protein